MIDGVASDEDKVAPVYKLEEICNLLRTSHVSIVKEFSDFILKRLDHKSPVVKQKALRLIKYSVGKSGVEFKREMQRNSAAIRQLFHYKGHLDPLKGDALNKAVRDTAQEAISAIFASDNNPPAPMEDINRRIEGFGNMNFEMEIEDKKSFFSEVVGLGSASIRQGLTTITTSHSLRKNDNGSYKSPILHRSPTTGVAGPDRCEKEEDTNDSWGSFGVSKNVGARAWRQDSRASTAEMTHGGTVSGHTGGKSCEERLLETIVTSGGVRLQPTRDALRVFLMEAAKLDAMALSLALESKLQSHLWQASSLFIFSYMNYCSFAYSHVFLMEFVVQVSLPSLISYLGFCTPTLNLNNEDKIDDLVVWARYAFCHWCTIYLVMETFITYQQKVAKVDGDCNCFASFSKLSLLKEWTSFGFYPEIGC